MALQEVGSGTQAVITLTVSANTLERNFRLIIALHSTQDLNPPFFHATPRQISSHSNPPLPLRSPSSSRFSVRILTLMRTFRSRPRAVYVACNFSYRYLLCLSADTNTSSISAHYLRQLSDIDNKNFISAYLTARESNKKNTHSRSVYMTKPDGKRVIHGKNRQ